MVRVVKIAIALLILAAPLRARAQSYSAPAYRLLPQSSAPANPTGVLIYADSGNGNHPTLKIGSLSYDLTNCTLCTGNANSIGGFPVATSTPSSGFHLVYNGSSWAPRLLAIGDLTAPGLIGSGASQVPPGNDARFPPAPGTANNAIVDTGSGYISVKDRINCRAYGMVGDGATDNATAMGNWIAAVDASPGATAYCPAGTYNFSSTQTIGPVSGISLVGDGELSTIFFFTGSSSSTAISLRGVSYSRFEGFAIKSANDSSAAYGTTGTGLLINGILGTAISTENTFKHLYIGGFGYDVRIGTIAYQADQSSFYDSRFNWAGVAGVSIEDSNAVVWNFHHCHWSNTLTGITANLGTGGSFNLYSCGFNTNGGVQLAATALTATLNTGDATASVTSTAGFPPTGVLQVDSERMTYSGLTSTTFTGIVHGQRASSTATHASSAAVAYTGFDIEVFTSSRGTAIVGCWAEGSGRFLRTRTGSSAAPVDLLGSSVNGLQVTDGIGMVLEASGGTNIVGGRYRGSYNAFVTPFQIAIGGNNNHRTMVNIQGVTFYDGNPFNTSLVRQSSIYLANVQTSGAASDSTPGPTQGFLPLGTPAAPVSLTGSTPNASWSPAAYVYIPSGTTLAPGDNTYSVLAKNCQGSSRVEVKVLSWGGVPNGSASATASDAGSGSCTLDFNLPWNQTLSRNLVAYVFINPDPWSVQ